MKKKKEDMYDNDFDRWGTTPGATYSLDDIDEIEEVDKGIDHIEEIEKFNPFHDGRGRFSSSRGMRTYSANPKTKAGQMAIARSTAAGYGAVFNVHRESKGENIRQNDQWIKSGQKPSPSQLARAQANAPKTVAQMRQNAHTNRVKGTMGATETATARHPSRANTKQQQNQQQNQQNQKQQQNQSQQTQTGIKDSTSQYKAMNKFQGEVDGKDITSTFTYNPNSRDNAMTQIMKAQGMNKPPKEIAESDFDNLVGTTKQVGHRTWHDNYSRTQTGADHRDALVDGTKVDAAGSGGRAFGSGIYITLTTPTQGANVSLKAVKNAQSDSADYGRGNGRDAQVALTMSPGANVIGAGKATYLFKKEPVAIQKKFEAMSDGSTEDTVNLWAAAKGFDCVAQNTWSSRNGQGYTYATLFNPSKVVVMDRSVESSKYGGFEGNIKYI